MISNALFLLILLLSSFQLDSDNKKVPSYIDSGNIIVEIKGLNNDEGQVRLFLHNNEDSFPRELVKVVDIKRSKIISNSAKIVFKDIPYGNYAIAAHHDENGNDEVDTNFLGIPNETFAASNDAKGRFGPKFKDAVFAFSKSDTTIIINFAKY